MIFMLIFGCASDFSLEEVEQKMEERYTNLCACLAEVNADNADKESIVYVKNNKDCYDQYKFDTTFRLSIQHSSMTKSEKDELYSKFNSYNYRNCTDAGAQENTQQPEE